VTPAVEDHVVALLALQSVPGLGLAAIRRLYERFGSGSDALAGARALSSKELCRVAGERFRPTTETLPALRRPDLRSPRQTLRRARELGLRVIPLGDPAYPARVMDLADPPPVVFVEGRGWPDLEDVVAIVGTRRASPYGRRVARRLARDLARRGWTVVSGMAAGIDSVAHEAALDAGGATIGVLGSGHERDYPPSNRALFSRMRDAGWLVSEFAPTVGPTRRAFPRRNRVIAALARAVVVVEAGERSGALNTAEHATEIGREVLAVPHRVDDGGAPGTLKLLREGAGVAAQATDIVDAVSVIDRRRPEAGVASPVAAGPAGRPGPVGPDGWLLALLGSDDLTPDEIAGRSV